jgi:predicted O-methyltransferase YrrM
LSDFADLAWLFTCDNRNRGLIRMNFDEAALLWRAVRETTGDILEIGSRWGGSTILLAASGRKVVTIDIDPYWSDQVKNVLNGRVELIVGDSATVDLKGRTFGLALIDGEHSLWGVAGDVRNHWKNIKPGGLVAFHDALPNDGLKHEGKENHYNGIWIICQTLLMSNDAVEWGRAGSMLIVKKK